MWFRVYYIKKSFSNKSLRSTTPSFVQPLLRALKSNGRQPSDNHTINVDYFFDKCKYSFKYNAAENNMPKLTLLYPERHSSASKILIIHICMIINKITKNDIFFDFFRRYYCANQKMPYICIAFEKQSNHVLKRIGRLAQLVQSVCLTSRGSGVRIPQRPPSLTMKIVRLFCFPIAHL